MMRYLSTVVFLFVVVMKDVECRTNELSVDFNQDYKPVTRGWVDTARTFVNGPMGQMAVQMAKEVVSRSVGNSQVNTEKF
jgi:hypothetical protein